MGVSYLELCSVVAQYPARNTLDRPRTFGGDEPTNRSQLLTYRIDWVSDLCIRPDPPRVPAATAGGGQTHVYNTLRGKMALRVPL